MIDTYCPYCDEGIEINHDDGYGYKEDETYEQECRSCGKTFAFTSYISYSYNTNRADCLNGGTHEWEPMHIYPKHWPEARRCKGCGKEERGRYDPATDKVVIK